MTDIGLFNGVTNSNSKLSPEEDVIKINKHTVLCDADTLNAHFVFSQRHPPITTAAAV